MLADIINEADKLRKDLIRKDTRDYYQQWTGKPPVIITLKAKRNLLYYLEKHGCNLTVGI
jgi:hypothetical protein